MNDFIIPVEGQHEYVVGIDFGHGETSADICHIQWNERFNQLESPETLEIIHNLKAIKSALLIEEIPNGDGGVTRKCFIGDEAISRYTSQHRKSTDGNVRLSYYACFKKAPSLMTEQDKEIMSIFMHEVYKHLRQHYPQLTDNNHLVYIACPSNPQKWDSDELRLYCRIALDAGLPIARIDDDSIGIIRESRAAFLKARFNPATKTSIKEGILLIDFGSSTVDLTYYSSLHTNKPIDGGGDCGASHFESIILKDLIKHNPVISEAITQFPSAETAILLSIRESKERFYKYTEEDLEVSISLTKVTAGAIQGSIEEYYSADQIDSLMSSYKDSVRECFSTFEKEVTNGKPIKLLFMTGGASRMGFVQEIAKSVFHYDDEVFIETDPSLTISNGIALAGRADLRAYALRNKLLSKLELSDNKAADVISGTAKMAAISSINLMEANYKSFAESPDSLSISSLEDRLKNSLLQVSYTTSLNKIYSNELRTSINSLINELNDIVGNYFPDESIPQISPNKVFYLSNVTNTPIDSIIRDSINTVSENLFEGSLKMIGILVGGVFSFGLAAIFVILAKSKAFFKGEKDDTDFWELVDEISDVLTPDWRDEYSNLSQRKRKKVYSQFLEKKNAYLKTLETTIEKELTGKPKLVSSINEGFISEAKGYIIEQINRVRLMLN